MNRRLWRLMLALVAVASAAEAQTVLHVNAAAPPGGDGQTWGTALNDLTLALAAAAPGTQVWVADGTYTPAPAGGERTATFWLPSGVEVYGGFAGNESALEQRDPAANRSVLSGDLNGDDDGAKNRSDNAYHVVTVANGSATLDGLVIVGGQADGDASGQSAGAGVLALAADVAVRRCAFRANVAAFSGAALHAESSTIALESSILTANTAGGFGAVAVSDSTITITVCIFRANVATTGTGGGLAMYASSATVTNSTFVANAATTGGAIWNDRGALTLENCLVWGNAAERGPEIASLDESTLDVRHSNIRGATDALLFGGVQLTWGPGIIDQAPWLAPDGLLQADSGCVDGGTDLVDADAMTPGIQPPPAVDVEGEQRFVGTGAVGQTGMNVEPSFDLGADEFHDADADGLPDRWESQYFGSAIAAAANADIDGDGLTNLQEFEIYGSHPNLSPIYVDPVVGDDSADGSAPVPQSGGVGPKRTLQAAIDAAGAGGTVLVLPGTYTGVGNVELEFGGRPVVLRASGRQSETVLDGGGVAQVLDVESILDASVVLEGVTLTGGLNAYAGGFNIESAGLRLRNCVVVGHRGRGISGGMFADLAVLELHDVAVGGVTSSTRVDAISQLARSDVHLPDPAGALYLNNGTTQMAASWVHGPGAIELAPSASLVIAGEKKGDPPTVIRSNVRGTGTIEVGPGQTLRLEGGAIVDLSGSMPDVGGECQDTSQIEIGSIVADGTIVVRDATIQNANVSVTLACAEGTTAITNNNITLPEASSGFGGELFISSGATVRCNHIVSYGDRYLDLSPSPGSTNPLIEDNQFEVIIAQGAFGEYGELLELRALDHDAAVPCPPGEPCAIQLDDSPGFADVWTLEKLELLPGARLNLTNRQGFEFNPQSGLADALYVRNLVLGESAILNTGFQRLYYQSIDMGVDSQIVDVPILGFSLGVIAMNDQTAPPANEFDVRVHTQVQNTPPRDPEPIETPMGWIARIDVDPEGELPIPAEHGGVMEMRTQLAPHPSAEAVTAKGAFARTAEATMLVAFDYWFLNEGPAELQVLLSDHAQIGVNEFEIARVYPPMPGRAGSPGSGRFAHYRDVLPVPAGLNLNGGTYLVLRLVGTDSRCWIDNWDPAVECNNFVCADFNFDYAVDGVDFLYALSEYGQTLAQAGPTRSCLDSKLNHDAYLDLGDLLAWDAVVNDPEALNACAGWIPESSPPPGPGQPVTVAPDSLLIAGKRGGLEPRGDGGWVAPQDDQIYTLSPSAISVDANGATIVAASACPAPAQTPASAAGSFGYRGNSRLTRDPLGNTHQLHSAQGLIRLNDAAAVIPPALLTDPVAHPGMAGNLEVRIGISPGDPVQGLPITDVGFSRTDATRVFILPVLVTPPDGAHYRAAARLRLAPNLTPPYVLERLFGHAPPNDPQCVPNTDPPGGSECDVHKPRELTVDAFGNLFVISAKAEGDNDWVLIYDGATGAERLRVQTDQIQALLKGPAAAWVTASGGELILSSSLNDPAAISTQLFRFGIQRGAAGAVTGLVTGGVATISNMRYVTAITEDPTQPGKLWVSGFMAPTFGPDDTFDADDAMFASPRLAIVPPTASSVTAAELACGNLSLPTSILFTQPATSTLITSANPPVDNAYVPGVQPFRDVLDTGPSTTLSAGVGGAGTPAAGGVTYAPVSVTFSAAPPQLPTLTNVVVTCTSSVPPACPTLASVSGSGAGPYLLTLSGVIPPGECTTITFTGTSPVQRLQYQSQPGNVNYDALTNTQDVLSLVAAINNGAAAAPANLARYDVNRSGGVNTADLLRVVQLLNGANTVGSFNGAGVAACP